MIFCSAPVVLSSHTEKYWPTHTSVLLIFLKHNLLKHLETQFAELHFAELLIHFAKIQFAETLFAEKWFAGIRIAKQLPFC